MSSNNTTTNNNNNIIIDSQENLSQSQGESNMDKVLRDAKGLASELHIRFTNWWNAMTPILPNSSNSTTTPKLPKTELDIKQALRKSMSFATPTTNSGSSTNLGIRLWFLGTPYFINEKDLEELNPNAFQPFLEDFSSRLWFTYRHHFPPLRPAAFTTDSGWGCMLRTGQCLLGQALVLKYLGRDWRLKDTQDPKLAEEYIRILSWFLDDYSSSSPFSLHRIALLGRQCDKEIGQWFGPHTTARVLRALVNDLNWLDLEVYVNVDGMVYKKSILPKDENQKMKPTLILLPIRLGVDVLNPVYYLALKSIFGFPQTVGIAGGKPSSSLYFVGFEDDNLFYLDPHQAHPSITRTDHFTVESFSSYHCQIPKKAPISSLDPSMLIGFYIKDEADFNDFCQRSEEIINKAKPIYRLADEIPVYREDIDIDCGGLSEDEDAII